MRLVSATLLARLPAVGAAWLPVGVIAYAPPPDDPDGPAEHVWMAWVDEDPRHDPGGWKRRVAAADGFAEGRVAPLLRAWSEMANGITWDLRIETEEAPDHHTATRAVIALAERALLEYAILISHLNAADPAWAEEAEGVQEAVPAAS